MCCSKVYFPKVYFPKVYFCEIFLHLIYNFFSILYILPPSGKRNCAIPGIAGEEHTDHTSHKYCASTKQNMLDGYSVAAEIKFKCLVALSGSQRPHKQNMCLQRPIWFSCGCQRNRHIHICGRVMVVIRTVDWTSSEKVLTGQVVRSLSRPCQGLTS